jgi:hypothetical protein
MRMLEANKEFMEELTDEYNGIPAKTTGAVKK